MSVSRRNFIKGAAVGAAAMYAAAGTAEARVAVPQKWDMTYDVVVIGYGGAGAVAAITAHDAKAKVVVLEKMKEGGGNTAVSAGGLFQPTDVQKGLEYVKGLFNLSLSDMNEPIIDVYVKEAASIIDWIKSLKPGTETRIYGYAGFPQVKGSECAEKWSVIGPSVGGNNLWALYTYAVDSRKIPVLYETPAKRLVTNAAGEVIGVIATQKGKDISIKASKGVVLACGGYEYSEEFLKNNVKGSPVYALGNPGNTGDGIRMAQEVGAIMWHMNGTSCPLGMKIPGYQAAAQWVFASPGFIWVDKFGKRFVNEKSVEAHAGLLAVDSFDGHALTYSKIPCYAIFDDKARAEGSLVSTAFGYLSQRENGGYKWSRDNLAEVEKGWIIKANSIKELAAKIKIDPAVLEETLKKWNTDVKNGEDTQFHRGIVDQSDGSRAANIASYVKTLSTPIETGPFYAVELWPALLNTQGGPRRNELSQVLNPYGEAIKRLYCAGELGSLWGMIYQGAGNNSESVVFGRIAGTNVAREKAW